MYEVGDRVEVMRYAKQFNGSMGTITRTNGWYIYVKLDDHPVEVEVYADEIKKEEQ